MTAETRGRPIGSVACVVPAYQAAPTLGRVVTAIREAFSGGRCLAVAVHVIVVDDGSRDATSQVAATCADEVVRMPRNQGKGAALRAGFATALEGAPDAILTVDADGQHDGAWAPRLVEALAAADLVLGVRERRRSPMPWVRRVSNAVSAAATSACAGYRWADTQCGFRAFRSSVLARIAPAGDRYEYETDFLIQAARSGVRIACVSVPTLYGAPSHFRSVRDSTRIVGTIARAVFAGARQRWATSRASRATGDCRSAISD